MPELTKIVWRVLQDVSNPAHVGTEQGKFCFVLRQYALERLEKLYHMLRRYAAGSQHLQSATFPAHYKVPFTRCSLSHYFIASECPVD